MPTSAGAYRDDLREFIDFGGMGSARVLTGH
jgi:hypothetical protein